MTTHLMNLAIGPFKAIASGGKIIESRLYDEKRRQITINDQIEFVCKDKPEDKVLVRVKALYRYESFEKLFSDFPPEYFGRHSRNDLLEEINTFYSKADVEKYGVIGIKIQLEK